MLYFTRMADVVRCCLHWLPGETRGVIQMKNDKEFEEGYGEFDAEAELRMMFPENEGEPDDGVAIGCMPWDND